jgi:anti-sigma regulatory factor (Ser/Thr protein kinase)
MSLQHGIAVPCVSLVQPATAAGVRAIRRCLSLFAETNGAYGRELAAIELAVSEAVANVVVHAYPDEPGEVRVAADVENGELEVVVVDDGEGFRPGPAPGLGLGLALMRHSATAFEVRDRPLGGVEVWLRFALEG